MGGVIFIEPYDSLEKGVIKLYNDVASRINSEKDILLDDTDIDRIIRGEKTDYDGGLRTPPPAHGRGHFY